MSKLAEIIEIAGERFQQIAPAGMQYNAEKSFAIQVLKSNKYLMDIAEREPASLQQALINVAAIGLSLSPAEKLAYLIPRKGKVCLDVSYIGMCRIATNSGSIQWIQSELVYSNDKFTHIGAGERPVHEFDPFLTSEQRGEFRGAYCVAKTSGGDYLTTMMNADEIYSVRDRSEAYKAYISKNKTCPWVTDFIPMAKKTVVRRGYNMWPRTDQHRMERMALAVQISNDNEQFESIQQTSPDLGQVTDEQKIYFDQLITQGNAIDMYALSQTISAPEMSNLYHSFEKGEKGKYQRIVDELIRNGAGEFDTYLAEFQDGGDVENEISATAYQLIQDRAV